MPRTVETIWNVWHGYRMFRTCRSGSLSSLAGGYRGISGIGSFYRACALSRKIFASENSYWSKKKGEPPQKLKGFTGVRSRIVKMVHHHHQWLCLAAWDQTFVRCYSVLARLLALVRRHHQVARCSWVPGCRSRWD